MKKVVALKCAEHSDLFALEDEGRESSVGRLEKLRDIEKLESKKSEQANKLKKEKQKNRWVNRLI